MDISNCFDSTEVRQAVISIMEMRDKLDTWLNGGASEYVTIDGEKVPTLSGLIQTILSSSAAAALSIVNAAVQDCATIRNQCTNILNQCTAIRNQIYGFKAQAKTLNADSAAYAKFIASSGLFEFGVPVGGTFTPAVSDSGDLSWTNDKKLTNPDTVNIKGPIGDKGVKGEPALVDLVDCGGAENEMILIIDGGDASTSFIYGTIFPQIPHYVRLPYVYYISDEHSYSDTIYSTLSSMGLPTLMANLPYWADQDYDTTVASFQNEIATYEAAAEAIEIQKPFVKGVKWVRIFVGSSMGGYWAAKLAEQTSDYCFCLLLNPVTDPAAQMAQFIGDVLQQTGNVTVQTVSGIDAATLTQTYTATYPCTATITIYPKFDDGAVGTEFTWTGTITGTDTSTETIGDNSDTTLVKPVTVDISNYDITITWTAPASTKAVVSGYLGEYTDSVAALAANTSPTTGDWYANTTTNTAWDWDATIVTPGYLGWYASNTEALTVNPTPSTGDWYANTTTNTAWNWDTTAATVGYLGQYVNSDAVLSANTGIIAGNWYANTTTNTAWDWDLTTTTPGCLGSYADSTEALTANPSPSAGEWYADTTTNTAWVWILTAVTPGYVGDFANSAEAVAANTVLIAGDWYANTTTNTAWNWDENARTPGYLGQYADNTAALAANASPVAGDWYTNTTTNTAWDWDITIVAPGYLGEYKDNVEALAANANPVVGDWYVNTTTNTAWDWDENAVTFGYLGEYADNAEALMVNSSPVAGDWYTNTTTNTAWAWDNVNGNFEDSNVAKSATTPAFADSGTTKATTAPDFVNSGTIRSATTPAFIDSNVAKSATTPAFIDSGVFKSTITPSFVDTGAARDAITPAFVDSGAARSATSPAFVDSGAARASIVGHDYAGADVVYSFIGTDSGTVYRPALTASTLNSMAAIEKAWIDDGKHGVSIMLGENDTVISSTDTQAFYANLQNVTFYRTKDGHTIQLDTSFETMKTILNDYIVAANQIT